MVDVTYSVNTLDQLAATVRDAHKATQAAWYNALYKALDAGDALIKAKARISSNWKLWVEESCSVPFPTAALYMQLARRRAEIEAERERVGDLSLRAARRLIAKPKSTASQSRKPVPDLLVAWRAATHAERTTTFAAIPDDELDIALPMSLRVAIAKRAKARPEDETFLRASEVLRRALSLVKIANTTPGITPIVAASNEKEALTALRQLNVMLANADIDEITVVKRYAKERRRAA